jgi:hypothetical protein
MRGPCRDIAVASRRTSKRLALSEFLEAKQPDRITEAVWRELIARLDPVSESYLRSLVRECGLPLDPLVEGVRQHDWEELERTLLALEREYGQAVAGGDRSRAAECRQAVLTAKEHARLAARRGATSLRTIKEEMISWMLVWLENPEAFPTWVRLRRKALAGLPGGTSQPKRSGEGPPL